MNLPNVLTMSRLFFAVILVILLEQNSLVMNVMAAFMFVLASATDYYDGYFAKRHGLVSDFGKIMDPIADKVLILAVLTVFAHIGMIAWWMVLAIALREILVTVSRLNAMRSGQVHAAERAGKIKTVVQMSAIVLVLGYLIADQSAFCAGWFPRVEKIWQSVINGVMVAAVLITLGSGAVYFRHKWAIDGEKH